MPPRPRHSRTPARSWPCALADIADTATAAIASRHTDSLRIMSKSPLVNPALGLFDSTGTGVNPELPAAVSPADPRQQKFPRKYDGEAPPLRWPRRKSGIRARTARSVMVTRSPRLDRDEFEAGDGAHRADTAAAADAQGLQREGVVDAPDQGIGADTVADRGGGLRTDVASGENAGPWITGGCQHRPGHPLDIGDAY